jgi:hypothetical protein
MINQHPGPITTLIPGDHVILSYDEITKTKKGQMCYFILQTLLAAQQVLLCLLLLLLRPLECLEARAVLMPYCLLRNVRYACIPWLLAVIVGQP